MTTTCRGCGTRESELLGNLPDGTTFAGYALPTPMPGGGLFRCHQCALVFRDPILPVEEYNELYAHASADVWAGLGGHLREDQIRVRNHILSQRPQGARVLDVGCYTGELLTALGPTFEKFGIEKSRQAALLCAGAGISIIGDDLYECHRLDDKFDVVVAMDVIEHTARPGEFIRAAMRLLSPGGMAIITTGDADNAIWRRLKAAFWYCSYPEHISFISESWLAANAGELGFRTVTLTRFPYLRKPAWKVYLKRCLVEVVLLFGMRGKQSWSEHISDDHMMAVLKR